MGAIRNPNFVSRERQREREGRGEGKQRKGGKEEETYRSKWKSNKSVRSSYQNIEST